MSGTAPPPAGGQDQSMDDILASIRRILNEDEAVVEAAEGAQANAPEAPDAEEPEAAPPAGAGAGVEPEAAPLAGVGPRHLTGLTLAAVRTKATAMCTALGIPASHVLLIRSTDDTGVRDTLAAVAVLSRALRRFP